MTLTIATWNINSIRLRLPIVLRLLEEYNLDILCLQETKSPDVHFPIAALKNAGYPYTVFRGEKSYNGVAIISRIPLDNIRFEPIVNSDTRHISAELPNGTRIHNFYIPAGGDEPDPRINPKFEHKLRFCEEAATWLKNNHHNSEKLILVGDLNIAPLEQDVWSHKQLLKVVSHTPIEVEKLDMLQDSLNWIDAARHFVPHEEKLYSWWSYRNQDWKKSNRGRRLDHFWVTPPLKQALISCNIPSKIRDWEKPSDHVPVIAKLKVSP